MKKNIYIFIGLASLLIGLLGAYVSLKIAFAVFIGLFVIVLFILDFQRVTYIVAFYLILDYVIRNYTQLPKIWGELLFALCIFLWIYKWIFYRGEKAYRWTPLEFPIFVFVGIGVFLLFFNSPSLRIGLEGFRVVMEYIFWFFATVQLLKTPNGAKKLLYVLVFVGFLISLDGIRQYIIAAEIPASWTSASEKVRTRVFSIVNSPNILGSLMVLLIPVSISFIYFEKKIVKKLLFAFIALCMIACLVFTFSRGAWVGFIVAMLIFTILIDKRLLIPLFICSIIAALFIPSIRDRITYMFSSQYAEKSQAGGRLGRAAEGLELLKQNLWFGVGLGRFGGAVAINNKLPGAKYVDNYYLKMLVETGILGFSAFLLLLYNVVAWSLRAIHNIRESRYVYLAQGILSGICGVIVHCLFENIFEYTAMSVYFWVLAGIIMFLGFAGNQGMLEKK